MILGGFNASHLDLLETDLMADGRISLEGSVTIT